MRPFRFKVRPPLDWGLTISRLDGGVNYSVPPDTIAANELMGALNFYYDPNTYRLIHRPGVVRYSASSVPGSGTTKRITGCYYSSVLSTFFVVANSVLYYLDSSKEPTSLGALTGNQPPFFMDFNGKCLVASGGKLQYVSGGTLSTISSAPNLSKIFHKDGRVWGTGDSSNPHRVWGSGPGDETDWNTTTGNAVYFDIEKNVGDKVVNADVYKDSIIVFKGVQQRGIFALTIPEGDYSKAFVREISVRSSALNMRSSIEAGNDLVFIDNTGIRSLVGVIQYGDIEQDPIGYKINSTIISMLDENTAFLAANPYYSQILIKYADTGTLYVYIPLKKSFMPIQFKDLIPWSACYREDVKQFFLGMDDGYLYVMDQDVYTDNGQNVPAFITTKRFTERPGTRYLKVLKSLLFEFDSLKGGTAAVEAIIDGGSRSIPLMSVVLPESSELLHKANKLLYDAKNLLYIKSSGYAVSNKFVNYSDISFRISNNVGAIKINRLEARCSTLKRRA